MKNLKHNINPKSNTYKKSKQLPLTSRISHPILNQKNETDIKESKTIHKSTSKTTPILSYHHPPISFSSLLMTNLIKYNYSKTKYEIKLINAIIYDEKRHIVSLFKNHLLWDETSDFLKRYYFKAESITRIPRISLYYEAYCSIFPIYFNLTSAQIMLKNIRKKKKLMDNNIEEEKQNNHNENNEEGSNKDDCKKENGIISLFIKPEEVNHEFGNHSQSQSSYSIRNIAENDPFHMTYKSNGNMDLSLTQYDNNSRIMNNNNLSSILNEYICPNSLSKDNSAKKNLKEKNLKSMKMKKLNFDAINDKHDKIYPKYTKIKAKAYNEKSKTERKQKNHNYKIKNNNNTIKYKENHKPHNKVPSIETGIVNHHDTHQRKNICLDLKQLIDFPKPSLIDPLTQRNYSSLNQNNSFNKIIYYRITSPDCINKTRKLILSNQNQNNKNTIKKTKPKYEYQPKVTHKNSYKKKEFNHILTITNPTSAHFSKKTSKIITVIKGHQTSRHNPLSSRPRLETEEKQKDLIITNSQAITPKTISISHNCKITPQIISKQHVIASENPLNIKVNLNNNKNNPTKSFTKNHSPTIKHRERLGHKTTIKTFTINNSINTPSYSHHRINQSSKIDNGISYNRDNSIIKNRGKKYSKVKYSRNTKIRLSNYPTLSSPLKYHGTYSHAYSNIYPTKKLSSKINGNITPINCTLNTNSHIMNIKKGTHLISPSIISLEAHATYNNMPAFPLTTRHTIESVPMNLVDKIINKITT